MAERFRYDFKRISPVSWVRQQLSWMLTATAIVKVKAVEMEGRLNNFTVWLLTAAGFLSWGFPFKSCRFQLVSTPDLHIIHTAFWPRVIVTAHILFQRFVRHVTHTRSISSSSFEFQVFSAFMGLWSCQYSEHGVCPYYQEIFEAIRKPILLIFGVYFTGIVLLSFRFC